MRLSGKKLLAIDRFFWLPHRLVEILFNTFSKTKDHKGPTLVIKFMGIGSIIRFASLCEEHGVDKQKILLLTLSLNRELCQLFGFTNCLFIRTNNLTVFCADCWRVFYSIKTLRPSLVIDYERCSHSVGLFRTLLAWRGSCLSMSFEPARKIFSEKQIVYPVDEVNLEQLFLRGIERMTKSNLSADRHEKVPYQQSVDIQRSKILININASDYLLARRYALDSYVEVIQALHQWDYHLQFYLSGSQSEANYAETLIKKLDGVSVHNVSGHWNLEKLSNELSDCALFITGDSGPLHLAVYLNVPTIAIWGPTQPRHFGYDDKPHLHNVSLNLQCSPCFSHPASMPARFCKGQIDCLRTLAPSVVSKKAIQVLSHQAYSRLINFPKESKTRTPPIVSPQLAN